MFDCSLTANVFRTYVLLGQLPYRKTPICGGLEAVYRHIQVTDRGLEPRTNCLRGNCSAIELVGLAAGIIPQREKESKTFGGQIIPRVEAATSRHARTATSNRSTPHRRHEPSMLPDDIAEHIVPAGYPPGMSRRCRPQSKLAFECIILLCISQPYTSSSHQKTANPNI